MPTLPGEKAKKGRRSRIVVNVDDIKHADEERRRAAEEKRRVRRRRAIGLPRRRGPISRRRLAFVAGGLAVVLVGALVVAWSWYGSYRRSPTYSLALLAEAAGRNDRPAVDALIDTDGVTRGLVPQVKAKIAERAGGPAPVPAAVRRYVEQNAGVLLPGARDSVRDAVVHSIRQGPAANVECSPFFFAAPAARFAADDIREEGDVATVTYTQQGRPVELMMQRSGDLGHWRVVAVKSDELSERIADNLARGLPALGR
jgi:Protein of unknown function (DUF2939)